MADITTPGCTLVIFGASGDLTQRKLIPALHSLDCEGLLPQELEVLGTGRTEFSNAEFRERLQEGVAEHGRLEPKVWSTFADRLSYMPGSYDDPEAFRRLGERLDQLDAEAGTHGNRLFYLAIPPGLYPIVTEQLGKSGLNQGGSGWARLVIEKPFGHDLTSAQELNDEIHAYFDEDQIYRIDHYLGKETVQNIMTFRFANAIFEPLWNRKYIDHVQITVAENVGVEHRTGYYDKAGVLRDMFQNHLMQLLALIAMEAPIAFQADALRDEKSKVLQAISPVVSSVRGQYRGYRDEPDVAEDSHTATYAALRLFVENWRWHDVPFYLRSGKQLQTKSSEIIIQFKHVPHLLFPTEDGQEITPNILYASSRMRVSI
jgi:glucose-6-phosphate 1-dehydrogenase